MSEKFVSERNLRFLLYKDFDVSSLIKYPRYADHSREVFDMIFETALKLGRDLFRPIFQEMDKSQPEFIDGRVKVHPKVKEIMKICGEGGWISAMAPTELGGQQLSSIVEFVPMFIYSAANYAASVYPYLTAVCRYGECRTSSVAGLASERFHERTESLHIIIAPERITKP